MNTDQKPVVLGTLPAGVPEWYSVLVSLIKDVGFPIVLSGYLLFRLDNQIADLIIACGGR